VNGEHGEPEAVNTATPMAAQRSPIEQGLSDEVSRLEGEIDAIRRATLEAVFTDTGGNLLAHAKRELELAGLFDEDADYGGDVARSVLDLVRVFATQGHSGGSAHLAIELFGRLARFDVLSPLTAHPADWMEVGEGLWQSKRKSSAFWRAGEAAWYDLDAVEAQRKEGTE